MSFVNSIVDKVYVINLDKDTERLAKADAELGRHGIQYTRFPAVLGSQVKESRHLSPFCNRFCTDGMKGCSLSHRAIWEEMIQNNYESVLILEDDFTMTPNFVEEFQRGWHQTPDDFDILWVGCNYLCGDPMPIPQLMSAVYMGKPEIINENVLKTGGSVGTHAYIIKRACAQRLVGLPIHTYPDVQMQFWIKDLKLKSYAITPQPIQTAEDAGATSSLTEKYPRLLGSVLERVPASQTTSLGWFLSEGLLKVGPFTYNALTLLVLLAALATPLKWVWVLVAWLGVEFLVSGDWFNTLKFLMLVGLGAGVRWGAGWR